MVLVVRMRRSHDMLNSVCPRHIAHLKANIPGAWAVVDVGKKMAMNVNHLSNYSAGPNHPKKRPSPKRRSCLTIVHSIRSASFPAHNRAFAVGIGDKSTASKYETASA